MNVERLTELVGRRGTFEVDPADPLLIIPKMFDASIAAAHTQLAKVVTDAADQIATSTVLSENNARARGERIITEGARFCSEQLRIAGGEAAKRVAREMEEVATRIETAAQTAWVLMWVSCAAAVVSLAGAAAVWFLR